MAVAVRQRIAELTGTFIEPGVSLNGRLYTPATIAEAVRWMQQEIADGRAPELTMMTGHPVDGASGFPESEENVRDIFGVIREVSLNDDGSADLRADIADTEAGRDVVALTAPDKPFVGHMSIRAYWEGEYREQTWNGLTGMAGDALRPVGVDLTRSPGIEGARIKSVVITERAPNGAEMFAETATVRLEHSKEPHVMTVSVDPAPAAEAATPCPSCKRTASECLIALDPDNDWDIDYFWCPSCGSVWPAPPELNADYEDDDDMSETTTETAPKGTATEGKAPKPVRALVLSESAADRLLAALEAKPTTETAPPKAGEPTITEGTTQPQTLTEADISKMLDEKVEAMRAEERDKVLKEHGLPARKGVVATPAGEDTRPLHELSIEELRARRARELTEQSTAAAASA